MSAIILSLLTTSLLTAAHAGVLFVDLNHAPQEYGACMEGAGEGNVAVVSQDTNEDGKPVTAEHIERVMQELEAIGKPATKIVLSAHQGAGRAFGDGGYLSAQQLTKILDRNPKTKASVTSIGMINCYGANVESSEQEWLLPNDNVKQVFGFPGQSPTKTAADTATLVADYCKNGERYARASTKENLCAVYPHIAGLTKQSVALCSREAIAARAYGPKTCYTYDELHQRCGEFDPNDDGLVKYMSYLTPDDPCGPYANPPLDKNSAYEGGASDLRDYYTKIHLWRQCNDQIEADRGYSIPDATRVIRLIKYDTIKTNLARLNARELADYDKRLSDLCLDQFRLGDITKLSRARMNEKIEGALAILGGGRQSLVSQLGLELAPTLTSEPEAALSREPAREGGSCRPFTPTQTRACPSGVTNPKVVATMANLLKETFVDLNYRSETYSPSRSCTHFHLVEENAPRDFRSECIVDYPTAASL